MDLKFVTYDYFFSSFSYFYIVLLGKIWLLLHPNKIFFLNHFIANLLKQK